MRAAELTGQKYGRWSVISRAPNSSKGTTRWNCVCECGTEGIVGGCGLTGGKSKSCGCWNREVAVARHLTHGLRHVPEYSVWSKMRRRCADPRIHDYHRYGGRGITVCNEWAEDFSAFYRDMGPRPTPKHSIDRIDNNSGYRPDNRRWATAKEQAQTRRRPAHWRPVSELRA